MNRLIAAAGLILGLAAPVHAQSQAEINEAFHRVTWAWNSRGPCADPSLCATPFETFGVSIRFNDGAVAPFAKVQRATASAHDCIRYAKDALARGDRGMAVQWVMASQLHNEAVRNWLRDNPDAVIAALARL
jgi:hypothetical protein